MKRFFLFLTALFVLQAAFAYDIDVILTKSRAQIPCIIISQNEETVTYRSADTSDNQIYEIPRAEIEKIYLRTEAGTSVEQQTVPAAKPSVEKPIEQVSLSPSKPKSEQEVQPVIAAPQDEITKQAEIKQTSPKELTQEEKDEQIRKFLKAKNVIKSSITLPEDSQNKEPQNERVQGMTNALFYATGFDAEQKNAQQIVENELIGKLSNNDDFIIQKLDSTIENATDVELVEIARQKNFSKVCFVNVLPFQNDYYLQAKIINVPTKNSLAVASTNLSLVSLTDMLEATDRIAKQLLNQLSNLKKEKENDEELRKIQASIEEQEKKRQQEEVNARQQEEMRRIQEEQIEIQEMLQQSTENLVQAISDLQASNNVYFLTISNPYNCPYKVVVAGRQVGVVEARIQRRFTLSTDLYGQVQLIQASGYRGNPRVVKYFVPKQSPKATLTLSTNL